MKTAPTYVGAVFGIPREINAELVVMCFAPTAYDFSLASIVVAWRHLTGYTYRMRIVSWNVNGLRAIHNRGDFLPFVEKEKADVLCIQEIKADDHQLPDELRVIDGYSAYFCSSKTKKGYSGVAIYAKRQPNKVVYGMGIPKFDDEGRLLGLFYDDFVILNVYFPNGGQGPHRIEYKMEYYAAFLKYIELLRKQRLGVIFCGDVNTAHAEIDLARPKENAKNTGFLPQERAWIDEVVDRGYVDVYRHFYPKKAKAYTYWDIKSRARERNVGWRIDYFFVNKEFLPRVKGTKILPDVMGSDHCPIRLDIA